MPKFVSKTYTKDSPADYNYANDLETRIGNAIDPIYDDKLDKGQSRTLTGKLTGTSVTVTFPTGYGGSIAIIGYVKHPTGGHWVGTGVLQMNGPRTNATYTVDAYYANQDYLIKIEKENF